MAPEPLPDVRYKVKVLRGGLDDLYGVVFAHGRLYIMLCLRAAVSAGGLFISHPWIQISIQNVREKVGEDNECRADDEDGHQQGVIALHGRLVIKTSHAGPGEDRLDQYST